ncbi:hypothetical protein K503DRAFT_786143, partial [Rhizopogon vinicolor AM-OR11-026]
VFYNDRVKLQADAAIQAENVATHGKKLAMRRDITRTTYATEDDSIKVQVKAKHQEALANWKQKHDLTKAGIIQGVDQDSKIRAFGELGAQLDHIFRHLSHKTRGLKFTCIAGGRDPSSGEVVVLDFHLGETETGAEFSAHCAGFEEIQRAYTDFIKEALNHDDVMRENNLGDDTDANTSGDSNLEGIVEGSNGGGDDENHGMDADDNGQWSDALYPFESVPSELAVDTAIASSAVATAIQPLPDLSIDPSLTLTSNGFNLSSLHTDDNSTMAPEMLPPLFDADATTSLSMFMGFGTGFFDEVPSDFSFSPSIPGLDFFPDYLSNQDNSQYGTLTPMGHVISPPTPHDDAVLSMLTTSFELSLPGPAMSHASDLDSPLELIPASQGGSSSTKDATLAITTNATSVLDPNNSDLCAGQSSGPPKDPHTPRRMTQPHVPSMREHVLNVIGLPMANKTTNGRLIPKAQPSDPTKLRNVEIHLLILRSSKGNIKE